MRYNRSHKINSLLKTAFINKINNYNELLRWKVQNILALRYVLYLVNRNI